MSYNHETQNHLNKMHLLHPKPGDYWHEMYCPVARVLDATDGWVIVQKVSGMGGKEISDTEPKPRAMKISAFKKWLSYGYNLPGTWAHVIPGRFPPDGLVVTSQNRGTS